MNGLRKYKSIIIGMKVNDFTTIKKLKSYVRSELDSIGICSSLREKNPAKFLFFNDLFQRHPERERKGVDKIVDIQIKQHNKGDYQMHIIKNDKTSDTISWIACVRKKGDTQGRKCRSAFRAAIDDQILEFRKNHRTETCLFCKSDIGLTVDHIVHFSKLKKDFYKLYPNKPTEFSKNSLQQHCFRDEDSEYAEAWANYHRLNADLRILCHSCNVGRDKYVDSSSTDSSSTSDSSR